MNKKITRAAQVTPGSVDIESRTAEFIISSESVDSYNTVFLADRWDFTRYTNNPVVSYNHNTSGGDPDFIIGTSEISRDGGNILAKVTFEPADENPLAEKILRKVSRGTLRGASVGVTVSGGEWGDPDKGQDPEVLYFSGQELLEWSVVNIPSNPDALLRNAEAINEIRAEITPDPVKKELKRASRFGAQITINKNKF